MAVFTPVAVEEARAFLRFYALGELLALEPVAEGVENTTYRLTAGAGSFALTLYEKRTPADALGFVLPLMEHAARAGLPVPQPARDRQGRLHSVLCGRPAALVAWLPGSWHADPSPAAARTAGEMLARLHLACHGFGGVRDNGLGPRGWVALAGRCGARAAGEEERMLRVLGDEAERLGRLWPRGLPGGAVHADYFPNNVLFAGEVVGGVIDWGFACTDAWAYDLAIAITAWGFSAEGEPEPARTRALVEGYGAVRPLLAAEQDALPMLCRGAVVRFTLTRLHDLLFHDPAWVVTPKDPWAYFRRLERFDARAAGLPAG